MKQFQPTAWPRNNRTTYSAMIYNPLNSQKGKIDEFALHLSLGNAARHPRAPSTDKLNPPGKRESS
jgi:hypothetical protein